MSASANDKFMKAGAGTVTTLSAPGKALSATSITVGSTTNYPTDTGIVFAIRQVDVNGELVAGTYTEWAGTVTSGTTLSMDAAPVYGSDQVYPAGSTTQVYIPLSSSAHNKMVDGLLVSHDQDGTLKAGAVDNAAVLATDVVETAKIKDAAVTPAKWTNPYKFYAYRSAAHNSSGTAAKVPYESELYDSNSNFSTANNDYTAPVAGFYDFHATAGNTAAASTPMQIILYKNGSAILYGQIIQPGAAGNNLTLSGSLQLAANDVIDVRFVGGGGSVMYTGATTCYFQGHLFTIT